MALSNEFHEFVQSNGIRHTLTAPYHPSSNGLAERGVRIFKEGIQKLDGPIEQRIQTFLFRYRITPQSTTGQPPAQLLMGRRLRSHLDLLHPDVRRNVQVSQDRMRRQTGERTLRTFNLDDKVYAKNYTSGAKKWIEAVVTKITGPLSYVVQTSTGKQMRKHADQLRVRYNTSTTSSNELPAMDIRISHRNSWIRLILPMMLMQGDSGDPSVSADLWTGSVLPLKEGGVW